MNLRQLNDPMFNPLLTTRMKTLVETGHAFFESAHRCKDGTIMPIEVNARLTQSKGRDLALSVIRDITERKRAEALLRENEARLKELFENLSSGVVVYCVADAGKTFTLTAINHAAERIENQLSESLLGKNVLDIFPAVKECGLFTVLQRVWSSGVAEHFASQPSKQMAGWREYYVYKLPNAEIVAIYDDVTQEKQAEAKMYRLAHYDILTDLPNRTLFSNRLHRALMTAQREQNHLALMFIDLDNFKPVNDQMGHAAGDLLLKEVAQRLQHCMRESDTVSRIGGDEFVVLLPVIVLQADALHIAENIRDAISQPFNLFGQTISISSSIGVAIYPEHGADEKRLIKHADIAMYYAKGNGRNNVTLYEAGMAG
jgi:diguanylate cyclase (GGDEF)-like protein